MGDKLPSIIFMGTPPFALPSLEALLTADAPILLVVTQPDRPKGRGRKVTSSPVKLLAEEESLPLFQPPNVKRPEAVERLAALNPDCVVVVAYGQLLPATILQIPSLGAVNVHASLLPKYRGPAPINWALIEGEEVTGITTMLMDKGMDTGDILMQREVAIRPEETAKTLHDQLAATGATLLVETLERLARGTLNPEVQDDSKATFAPMLRREDGRVDWREDAKRICCRIRGLDPWPGGFTWWQGKRLKLSGCEALPDPVQAEPGTVMAAGEEGLQVATGNASVLIKTLQIEGRRPHSVPDFLRGHSLQVGSVLDE